MSGPAIVVDHVRKSYGDVRAVDGVSLTVERGDVYGLLGHNGAGNTTMVGMLEGFRAPTSGTVSVLGYTPSGLDHEFRDRVGIVLQSMTVERFLTVRVVLQTFADVYTNPRPVDEVIELVGLSDKADARRQSWDLVKQLCDGGTTVLLTTHYLDEAEQLADRVGVLAHGVLVAEGTPADLIATVPATRVSFGVPEGIDIDSLQLLADAQVADRVVRFASEQPTAEPASIINAAVAAGVELEDLQVRRPAREDVFLGMDETSTDPAYSSPLASEGSQS